MSKNIAQIAAAVRAIRQAQLAQLDPDMDESAAAATLRALHLGYKGLYLATKGKTGSDLPPGPLRDCYKEISPNFDTMAPRWDAE